MKELKITDDRVREAAASCEQAKEVLKKLFPEVFEEQFVTFVGQKYVQMRSDENIRSIATTYPEILNIIAKCYSYPRSPVVAVLASCIDQLPDCWPYEDWGSFHKTWKIIPYLRVDRSGWRNPSD